MGEILQLFLDVSLAYIKVYCAIFLHHDAGFHCGSPTARRRGLLPVTPRQACPVAPAMRPACCRQGALPAARRGVGEASGGLHNPRVHSRRDCSTIAFEIPSMFPPLSSPFYTCFLLLMLSFQSGFPKDALVLPTRCRQQPSRPAASQRTTGAVAGRPARRVVWAIASSTRA